MILKSKHTPPLPEKNNVKIILNKKINIKAGKMTFGQRIEIGKIFQSEISDVEKVERVFECLHSYKPKPNEYAKLIEYFKEIIDGFTFWVEQETTLLHYEPTDEELQAGIKEFSQKVGEFGTVKSLAKAYGKDPDEILQWEYGKVFGILYTDLEENKFQRKYNKVIEAKYKK